MPSIPGAPTNGVSVPGRSPGKRSAPGDYDIRPGCASLTRATSCGPVGAAMAAPTKTQRGGLLAVGVQPLLRIRAGQCLHALALAFDRARAPPGGLVASLPGVSPLADIFQRS